MPKVSTEPTGPAQFSAPLSHVDVSERLLGANSCCKRMRDFMEMALLPGCVTKTWQQSVSLTSSKRTPTQVGKARCFVPKHHES